MFVSKIVVTRSLTLERRPEVKPYVNAWQKFEHTLEATLTEKDNVEETKAFLCMLLDAWLEEEKTKWLKETDNVRRG
jgi:actin-related protein